MPYLKTSDGINLYYEKTGSGIPVIFVHEFAGDHRSWEPQINFFSRNFTCITYSARGYTPSDVPNDTNMYSQERAWQDIRDVIEGLDLKKAHIVGLSMGGFATLHFGINCPNLALSLCIAGCGYGAKPKNSQNDEGFSIVSENTAKDILNRGMKIVGSEYALGPSRVQFQNKDYNGWKKFNDMLVAHDQTGSTNTLLGIQSKRPNLYNLTDQIEKIEIPTLIVNGDEDDMCTEVGIYLKRAISSSGLFVVPKTGHTINLEEPALFNQQLASFYQSIENKSWKKRDKRAQIITN